MVGVMSIFIVFMASSIANKDPSLIEAALESQDSNEKLNFLIQDKTPPFDGKSYYWLFLIMLAPIIVTSEAINKGWAYLFPSNLFLFGEKKKRHGARMAFMSRVFWGVGVAFLVSIIAGIIVWKMTS